MASSQLFLLSIQGENCEQNELEEGDISKTNNVGVTKQIIYFSSVIIIIIIIIIII